jgi:phosphoribosylamine--glycine ligase
VPPLLLINPFFAPPQQVVEFCKSNDIGLVLVGPEAPLVAGLADDLVAAGIRTFGPSAAAAQLEGSKKFMKVGRPELRG